MYRAMDDPEMEPAPTVEVQSRPGKTTGDAVSAPPPARSSMPRSLGRLAALIVGTALLMPGVLFIGTLGYGLVLVCLLRLMGHESLGLQIAPPGTLSLIQVGPRLGEIDLAGVWALSATLLAALAMILWRLFKAAWWRLFWALVLGVTLGATAFWWAVARKLLAPGVDPDPSPDWIVIAALGLGAVLLLWRGAGAALPPLSDPPGYLGRVALFALVVSLPWTLYLAVLLPGSSGLAFQLGILGLGGAALVAGLVRPARADLPPARARGFLALAVIVAAAAGGLWYLEENLPLSPSGFVVVPSAWDALHASHWEKEGRDALYMGRNEEARGAFLRLSQVRPEGWKAPLGLAMAAAAGDVAEGIDHLKRAVQAGRFRRDWLEGAEELVALRDEEGWEAVLALASERELPDLDWDRPPRAQAFSSVGAARSWLNEMRWRDYQGKHDELDRRRSLHLARAGRAAYIRLAETSDDEDEVRAARHGAALSTAELAQHDGTALERLRRETPALLKGDLEPGQEASLCWEWTSAERAGLERTAAPGAPSGDWLPALHLRLERMAKTWRGTPCSAAVLARLVSVHTWEEEGRGAEEAGRWYEVYLEEHGGDPEEVRDVFSFFLAPARIRREGVPPFKIVGLDGNELSQDALRGKVVLIDFWATWCGPCVKEIPHLRGVYKEFHDQGFEIVGISLDRADNLMERLAFRAWLWRRGVCWPQHLDGRGWETPLARELNIHGIPTTILLDREGRVVDVDLRGDRTGERVKEVLRSKAEGTSAEM